MWSHARVKQIFLLVSACVMCTHFTIVYLFIRETFMSESEQPPATWYVRDLRSPLEYNDGPHWGSDQPFTFQHNLSLVLRELKSHVENSLNGTALTEADIASYLNRQHKRDRTQYRNLYDNYGGYEYQDLECNDLQEPQDDFDEPLIWQDVVPRRVFVFSAYLEPGGDGGGKIVVIGMGDSIWLMEERYYCQVWYRSGNPKVKVVKAVLERVEEHHELRVVVNFWYCEADIKEDPFAVYIVHRTPCTNQPLNTLLIRNIDESQARTRTFNNFTVCISPLVNSYNNSRAFVENAEMNLLLGGSVLVYYDYSTTNLIKRYLSSYKNEDLANVIPWTLPFTVPNNYGLKVHYFAQLAALNDCLYRYRYTSRYIIFTDLDELIVPRKDKTWAQLFRNIHNRSSPVSVFRFHHVLFPLNAPDDASFARRSLQKTLGLVTQLKTKRDPIPWPNGVRSKYAVVPRDVDMVGVHSVLIMKKGRIKDVGTNTAMLHHYREWDMGKEGANLTEDKILHSYQNDLIQRVVKRHKVVQGRVV